MPYCYFKSYFEYFWCLKPKKNILEKKYGLCNPWVRILFKCRLRIEEEFQQEGGSETT